MSTILDFTYKNGRGRLQLDVERFICGYYADDITGDGATTYTILRAAVPCTGADVRKLCGILDLSEDPAENARPVYDYITRVYNELHTTRADIVGQGAAAVKYRAKLAPMIKKCVALAGILADKYGFDPLADDTPKLTACTAIEFQGRPGSPETYKAVEYKAKKFTRDGLTFYMIRKNGVTHVLDARCGLSVLAARNPAEAVEKMDDLLLRRIRGAEETVKTVSKLYRETIENNFNIREKDRAAALALIPA